MKIFTSIIFLLSALHGAFLVQGNQLSWRGHQSRVVSGVIVSLPTWTNHHYQWVFKAKTGRWRVSCYGHCPRVNPGERWQFHLKMTSRDRVRHFLGFDYGAYLMHHRLAGTAYVQANKQNRKIGFDFLADPIDVVRSKMRHWIKQRSWGMQKQNLILALTLGDRSGLQKNDWQVFQNTGTSHLVAISGLHIGLAAALVFLIFRWLWSVDIRLSSEVPSVVVASVAALIGAVLYSALAGFSVPTERALIMISVLVFARLSCWSLNPYLGLLFAAILVLLWNPFAVFFAGTWLSYLAVLFLIYGYQGYQPRFWFWRWMYPQVVVFIGLLPLTIGVFGQFSLVAMLANLVAIPVVSFLVVPLLLIALMAMPCFALSHFIFSLADHVLLILWWYLQNLSSFPMSHLLIAKPDLMGVVSGTLGSILLLTPSLRFKRLFGLLWWLPVVVRS